MSDYRPSKKRTFKPCINTIKLIIMYTFHLTDYNTITFVKATKNDDIHYCFDDLQTNKLNYERQGYKVIVNV